MAIDPRDPDASLVVQFKMLAQPNEAKSAEAGRLVCDDVEVVQIFMPGNRLGAPVFPATAFCGWVTDPMTGGQKQHTYAERFAKQYRQFKEQAAQTVTGTPLLYAPFLTEARRAELRALNIYTVEQLAHIDGQELKNVGPGGREMKNKAEEFIASARSNAPNIMMVAELEQLRAKNAILEEDLQRARSTASSADVQFDDMSDQQIRELIESNTGHAPRGDLSRKTLVKMALESRPSRAA